MSRYNFIFCKPSAQGHDLGGQSVQLRRVKLKRQVEVGVTLAMYGGVFSLTWRGMKQNCGHFRVLKHENRAVTISYFANRRTGTSSGGAMFKLMYP